MNVLLDNKKFEIPVLKILTGLNCNYKYDQKDLWIFYPNWNFQMKYFKL